LSFAGGEIQGSMRRVKHGAVIGWGGGINQKPVTYPGHIQKYVFSDQSQRRI